MNTIELFAGIMIFLAILISYYAIKKEDSRITGALLLVLGFILVMTTSFQGLGITERNRTIDLNGDLNWDLNQHIVQDIQTTITYQFDQRASTIITIISVIVMALGLTKIIWGFKIFTVIGTIWKKIR